MLNLMSPLPVMYLNLFLAKDNSLRGILVPFVGRLFFHSATKDDLQSNGRTGMTQYQEVNGEKERRVLNIKITTDFYGQ